MARGSALFGPVAICLLSVVSGQQNPPPVPQSRTRVDLVVLDVSVLDRDRRRVRGLSAADFSVLEDGRRQSIQMFTWKRSSACGRHGVMCALPCGDQRPTTPPNDQRLRPTTSD